MLGALGQSIAITGQKLGEAELASADVVIRPQVLDIGLADFAQRASTILEGEKAALAAMPQVRERIAQLQAERARAAQLAQEKVRQAEYKACLEKRSSLQKLAGMAGMGVWGLGRFGRLKHRRWGGTAFIHSKTIAGTNERSVVAVHSTDLR